MKNYYKILRINSSANIDEIKHSYRILAHKYHPDKAAVKENSSDLFLEIKEAYDTLIDTIRRKNYDFEFNTYYKSGSIDFEEAQTKNDAFNNQDVLFIFNELNKFRVEDSDKIVLENLKNSIETCKERLINIKSNPRIGKSSYIDISSTVVRNSIDISEKIWNQILDVCFRNPSEIFKSTPKDIAASAALSWLEGIITNIIIPIESIEMNNSTEEQYFLKSQYYLEIKEDLKKQIPPPKIDNKGCYIATMAYGSQNHINVVILRYYRDEYLNKYFLGRIFIRLYYNISPCLVHLLKDKRFINAFIRKMLNIQANKIVNRLGGR